MNTVPNTPTPVAERGLDPTFHIGSGNLIVDLLRMAADVLVTEAVPTDAVKVDAEQRKWFSLDLRIVDDWTRTNGAEAAIALADRLADRLHLTGEHDHTYKEDGRRAYTRYEFFGPVHITVMAWPIPDPTGGAS